MFEHLKPINPEYYDGWLFAILPEGNIAIWAIETYAFPADSGTRFKASFSTLPKTEIVVYWTLVQVVYAHFLNQNEIPIRIANILSANADHIISMGSAPAIYTNLSGDDIIKLICNEKYFCENCDAELRQEKRFCWACEHGV